MKKTFLSLCLAILSGAALPAQPSFTAPPPSKAVVPGADTRREAYDQRIDEALAWRSGVITLSPRKRRHGRRNIFRKLGGFGEFGVKARRQ